MMLEAGLIGAGRLSRCIGAALDRAAARERVALLDAAREIARDAGALVLEQRNAASGSRSELAESIEVEVVHGTIRVVARAAHAPFIEFGTAFMPAEPFLGPAFEAACRKIRRRLSDGGQRT